MGIAFVFPGQGSQYVGMGSIMDTQMGEKTREIGKSVLGDGFLRLLREGPEEELRQTANTQPAILLASVAAWRLLDAAGIRADYLAGHSLGEYSAHVAAGSLTLEEALRVVRRRGELMEAAVPNGTGTMAAVLGLSSEEVEAACKEVREVGVAVPANYNSPGQIVISGERAAVEAAMEAAKRRGAKKVIPLSVSGPFHSPMMQRAAGEFARVLDEVNWQKPTVPVIANVDGREVTGTERLKETLVKQLSSAVRWEQSVCYMAEQGVGTFIECGPGKVLTGLIKKIVPRAYVVNVEDLPSLEKSLAYLKESR